MDTLPAKIDVSDTAIRQTEGRLAATRCKITQWWQAGRAEMSEGLTSAGASVERIHRRLALCVVALVAVLIAGAAFRSIGWPEGNYLLIMVLGAGALYALLSPVHIAGVLLVSGGVAAARGMAGAQGALLAYARLLGQIFLAFLLPLFLFATAPGDPSFATSLRLIVLAPVAGLAIWLFGRLAPRAEKLIFVTVPLAALTVTLLNMLIPERTLAVIGVPAWLRASRPQDEELAKLESAIEARRNAERAARLRIIRGKIERGEPLSAEDQSAISWRNRIASRSSAGWASGIAACLTRSNGARPNRPRHHRPWRRYRSPDRLPSRWRAGRRNCRCRGRIESAPAATQESAAIPQRATCAGNRRSDGRCASLAGTRPALLIACVSGGAGVCRLCSIASSDWPNPARESDDWPLLARTTKAAGSRL